MKLLTNSLRQTIPPLYSQEDKGDDAMIQVKFFTPWAPWTWYVIEGEPQLDDNGKEIDYLFFGMVHGDEKEFGYFYLSELESVTGPAGLKIERDLYFKPRPLNKLLE